MKNAPFQHVGFLIYRLDNNIITAYILFYFVLDFIENDRSWISRLLSKNINVHDVTRL